MKHDLKFAGAAALIAFSVAIALFGIARSILDAPPRGSATVDEGSVLHAWTKGGVICFHGARRMYVFVENANGSQAFEVVEATEGQKPALWAMYCEAK